MTRTRITFTDYMMDWPWKLFIHLKPAFIVVIIMIGLGAWAIDPAGLWTLGIVGVAAAVLSQKFLIGVAAIVICVLVWAVIQIIEMVILMAVATYAVSGISGGIAYTFDLDPMTIFKKRK